MSAMDRIERRLPDLLDELAVTRTPEYFDDILSQVDRTRQRPGWTFLERWLPMTTLTDRMAIVPRGSWRLAFMLVALLIALVVSVAIFAGVGRQSVPAPFGVAGNGDIAYVDASGAILSLDLDTGTSTPVIAREGIERPIYSPDGTRIAWVEAASSGALTIVVAAADGSDPVTMTSRPYSSIDGLGWSADGAKVIVNAGGDLVAFDATTGDQTAVLGLGIRAVERFGGDLSNAFRPPVGDEVLYISSDLEIHRLPLDGGATVRILTPDGPFAYADLYGVQWSPDGERIAFTARAVGPVDDYKVYVMDADGTDIQRLTRREDEPDNLISEGWPQWSPDGSEIAIMRWFNPPAGVDPRPITVVDVASGAEREVGSVNVNGYDMWGWSPDGSSILEVASAPSDDADHLVIVDATTGEVTRTGIAIEGAPSWQRTAP
jgi:WD40-like Beta Propeller Repeat